MILRVITRLPYLVAFIGYFIWELVRSNIRVAWDVITITHYMKPGILAVPLEAETNLEITLLANFISLTPGTLSLDVSSDHKVLFVHAMYLTDIDDFKAVERRLLRVLR